MAKGNPGPNCLKVSKTGLTPFVCGFLSLMGGKQESATVVYRCFDYVVRSAIVHIDTKYLLGK